MIIKYRYISVVILLISSCDTAGQELRQQDIMYADPTVILDGDKYYMTGTGSQTPPGFTILMSDNLKGWITGTSSIYRFILNKGTSYGDSGFWAPQWLKINGSTYYFTYTANEQTVIVKGDEVTGPFKQEDFQVIDDSGKNIDSFLFKDDDGTYYLYHVRFNSGNYIWVAEFDIQEMKIRSQTLKLCLHSTEPWERTENYVSNSIMEGPSVVKWDGLYYLFYSANHYLNIDYAVVYATSTSPISPWIKYGRNPIIHRNIVNENGSGHGDVFKGKDGVYYYVYHVHNSNTEVSPRRTRIVPLHLSKGENGIYNISVGGHEVVKPFQSYWFKI